METVVPSHYGELKAGQVHIGLFVINFTAYAKDCFYVSYQSEFISV